MMNLYFYGDFAKFFICAFLSVNTGQLLMFSGIVFWVLCVVVAWGNSSLNQLHILYRKILFVEWKTPSQRTKILIYWCQLLRPCKLYKRRGYVCVTFSGDIFLDHWRRTEKSIFAQPRDKSRPCLQWRQESSLRGIILISLRNWWTLTSLLQCSEWDVLCVLGGSTVASAYFSAADKKGKPKAIESNTENFTVYESPVCLHLTTFIWHLLPPVLGYFLPNFP